MAELSGKPKSRRSRLLAILIASLVLLLTLLGAVIRSDQPASALSRTFLEPPAPIAEQDNAALLLVDFASLPGESPNAETHGFASLGTVGESLLAWSAQHAAGLDALRRANALRLQRLSEAQQRSGWQCTEPARCMGIDVGVTANLRRTLIALDFARARAQDDEPSMALAVSALAEEGEFWNRLAAQADHSLVAMLAVAGQRAVWGLTAEMAEALPPATRAALGPALLLRLEAAPVNWDSVMRGDARRFRFALPGTEPGGRDCTDPGWLHKCLSWTERLSYQPQATLNLWVELHDALAQVLSAAPGDRALAEARYARARALIEPKNLTDLSAHWSYNHAGLERIRLIFFSDALLPAMDPDQERLRLRQRVSAALDPLGAAPLPGPPFE